MTDLTAPPSETTDVALVVRMAGGDEDSLRRLYDRHAPVLYALAIRLVGERADADEVMVDAFAQAWRESGRFDATRGSVPAWLTMIVRSRALDLIRSRSRRDRAMLAAAMSEADGVPAMGSYETSPVGDLEGAERGRLVQGALRQLPTAQREVIELAYFGGLSQSEIAARLGEPLGTVKTRIRFGMQKLRESLGEYYRR